MFAGNRWETLMYYYYDESRYEKKKTVHDAILNKSRHFNERRISIFIYNIYKQYFHRILQSKII